ncbi:MAG: sigma-70 family RNA polymerase sigma factor [Solirubrobacteraceae bacterium]
MEVSTLKTVGAAGMRGPTPLLRLASDERLVVLTRRGNQAAFEALVARYQSRLLAFCRHMLASREDAEDVLQEVFAAAFNAMCADERPINVRPWLYRIARNRSLNHLRKATAVGVDSMDIHVAEQGTTTAEKVHKREEFRLLMADVQTLPETQRTALLLREIDALSYEQIAEAMDTTIPSVKSLLVRARVSLAELAEARTMSCEDVREELGEVAEGIKQRMSPPVRRHVKQCERCGGFRKQLRDTNKALAAMFPIGPLLFLKKTFLAQLGTTASAGGAAAGASSAAAGTVASSGASALASGMGAMASKTVAGLTAAAIVTAGAVEVQHSGTRRAPRPSAIAAVQPAAPVEPQIVASAPQPDAAVETAPAPKARVAAIEKAADKPAAVEPAPTVTTPTTTTPTTTVPTPVAAPVEGSDVTTLPTQEPVEEGTGQPAQQPQNADGQTTTPTPAPAPAPPPEEQPADPAAPPPAQTTPVPPPAVPVVPVPAP